mmetsp:Transcript_31134/g.41353  ORF Transcript_31134/g.41353 Transcript_31134/m.41353 type:complete len:381 (-) Transcript_31134:203-1345(-)
MINASSTTTLVCVILTLTFLPASVSCFLSTTPSSLCVGIVPLSQQQPHFPMTQPPKRKKCNDSITTLYGVLSRSTILSSKERHNKQRPKKANVKNNNNNNIPMTTDFLLRAIEEALYQQDKILQALSKNEKRTTQVKNDDSIISSSDVATTTSTANSRTVIRRNEVTTLKHKLLSLKQDALALQNQDMKKKKATTITKEKVISSLQKLGFQSILQTHPNTWKSFRQQQQRQKEFGRPKGFTGRLFTSPAGVPILIGKEGTTSSSSHADETLRRISQGSDLWFQVYDYNGSRVLLRTSLKRGMKGSKGCMQMAANLAAYFSYSGGGKYDDDDDDDGEGVRVMYTDSKHVAKRGSKVGQMRRNKSLGFMMGYPLDVEDVVCD